MPNFKKNNDTYELYIHKILKDIDPDLRITKQGIRVMDDLMSQVFVDLKKRSMELTYLDKRQIMSGRTIKFANWLDLPNTLGHDANKAAAIALMRYNGEPDTRNGPYKAFMKDLAYVYPNIANASFEGQRKGRKAIRQSKRAGVRFDVGRIERHLHENSGLSVGKAAPIAIAASLDLVTSAIFYSAIKFLQRRKTITPRHIMRAIELVEELNILFKKYVIMNAGVVPDNYYEQVFQM